MKSPKQIQKIKSEADQVLTVDQFRNWFTEPNEKKNLALLIGLAHVKYNGYYTCMLDEKLTFVN